MKKNDLKVIYMFGIVFTLTSISFNLQDLNIGWLISIVLFIITIIAFIKYLKTKEPFKFSSLKEFEFAKSDNGLFIYHDHAFTVNLPNEKQTINWTQIVKIEAHLTDIHELYQILGLDIYCENHFTFAINQDTAGWYKFLDNLNSNISSINKNWEEDYFKPARKKFLTVIYENPKNNIEIKKGNL